jgi:hypothetical protein
VNRFGPQVKDYNFTEKNLWRRCIWEVIAEQERAVSPRHWKRSFIVYMPSYPNYDIEEAVRSGFRVENMLGVDKDPEVCSRNRSEGVTMVEGDLLCVLAGLARRNTLPDVVVADFCSPFNEYVARFIDFLMYLQWLQSREISTAINLLRGRDAVSNAFREGAGDLLRMLRRDHGDGGPACESMLHRAGIAYTYGMLRSRYNVLWDDWDISSTVPRDMAFTEVLSQSLFQVIRRFPVSGRNGRIGLRPFDHSFLTSTNCTFMSYRSAFGSQVFDSCVWLNKFQWLPLCAEFDGKRLSNEWEGTRIKRLLGDLRNEGTDRKLAAWAAIRTRRGVRFVSRRKIGHW